MIDLIYHEFKVKFSNNYKNNNREQCFILTGYRFQSITNYNLRTPATARFSTHSSLFPFITLAKTLAVAPTPNSSHRITHDQLDSAIVCFTRSQFTYLIVALLQLDDPEFEQFILLAQLVALAEQTLLALLQVLDPVGQLDPLARTLRRLKVRESESLVIVERFFREHVLIDTNLQQFPLQSVDLIFGFAVIGTQQVVLGLHPVQLQLDLRQLALIAQRLQMELLLLLIMAGMCAPNFGRIWTAGGLRAERGRCRRNGRIGVRNRRQLSHCGGHDCRSRVYTWFT